ncbi:unnamed protein product [Rotaria magnacalcarata]|uniref:Uncharacterized protein n=3 Tax=Rotaria TaxID=231623 RepID=A0A818BHP6_9BILA|nr:unnamed protein product [Rotaria magnacalcarata]CAF3420214.1 unnamed protein product [Rotaria socialis]CAF3658719.1 unnamed protein product [Rotaria socialis]
MTSEASIFLADRAYHINQRYIYRWYTYMPAIFRHETYSWINENILSKININDIRDEMIVTIDIEQQNNVAVAASFIHPHDVSNSRTKSLVRHRHRQHEQHHQVKSGKTTLRPGPTTQNPLGRGRHATDTSSLSCCSIKFVLSNL